MKLHPFQEIEQDALGVIRFRHNAIVRWLADNRINDIARKKWPVEDLIQFNQLIGYSVDGYCELDRIPDRIKDMVSQEADRIRFGVEPEEDPQKEIQRLRAELAYQTHLIEQIKSILSGEEEDTSDEPTPG